MSLHTCCPMPALADHHYMRLLLVARLTHCRLLCNRAVVGLCDSSYARRLRKNTNIKEVRKKKT